MCLEKKLLKPFNLKLIFVLTKANSLSKAEPVHN